MMLDPDTNEARRAAHEVVDALLDWQQRRDALCAWQPTEAAAIEAAMAPPSESAGMLAAVLASLFEAAQGGWNKRDGGDFAYVPSGGIASGAWAAYLAAGIHAFTGASFEAPALIALEESVLRWLAGIFGLPADSEGVFLSGGSIANQTAIASALASVKFDAKRHVAYLSERAHHSLHKSLRLSGVPESSVRTIATEKGTRFDLVELERQMQADCMAGKEPWLLVGTAGNTDTGAVDDLPQLAALARRMRCWFHVDAAYGGMFVLTARGKERLRGIEAADSVTVDAHKGLGLPYGISALLVRRPGALERAHGGTGAYHRDVPKVPRLPHYFLRSPELTRPYRGLLIWLPLHLHGVAAFREVLDRSLDLATEAAARLRTQPRIEVVAEPDLSVVALRSRTGDAATQALLDAVNGSGQLHASSTMLDGRVALRLVFLHARTTVAHLHDLLAIVERQALID